MDNLKIDLSPEALQKRREIAEKAPAGPWMVEEWSGQGTALHIKQAKDLTASNGALIASYVSGLACKHIIANSPDAVIAMIDEIEHLRSTVDGYNESNGEAQEIIAEQEKEIERLRAENASLLRSLEISEDASGLTAAYMAGQMDKIDTIGKLKEENTRLEKEADWLAKALDELGEPESECYDSNIKDCPNPKIRDVCYGDCAYCWRESARNAVEEQCKK